MRSALTLLLSLASIGTIHTQEKTPPKQEVPAAPAPADTFNEVLASTAVGQQHRFGLQVQFGTPTGIRGQYAVYQAGDHSFLLELFAGGRSTFWGDEPVYGLGTRASFNLTSDGNKNALVFSPGIGISYWQAQNDRPAYFGYYYPNNYFQSDRWFLNLDANIGWLHELTPSIGWELGINFGARIGLSGHENGGSKVGGHAYGNIGFYTGFRY